MNKKGRLGARSPELAALSQRITERRKQLGMSERLLARQTGMSPKYLEQLIEVGPDFDPGAFLRVAVALNLTYHELLEGRIDAPPGQSGTAGNPTLIRLSTQECWDKLGTRGVGRIALPVQPGPTVFPVNYMVDVGTIVYRTASHGSAAPADGTEVSFQVDRMDDAASRGWSVLITGTAQRVEDPAEFRRLADQHAAEPWAGGNRPLWIRIRPNTVTGRNIVSV